MRRVLGVLLASVVVAAAGFAVASIASGARLLDVLTGTTETTATTTTAPTTTGAGSGAGGRTATVCHLTGSKKHPAVTITVGQNAVAAVIKGGGHLGPCTGTETSRTHVTGSANGLGKGHNPTTTTTTTTTAPASTTTTSSPSGQDNGHGNNGSNNGSGHGNNGSGHGRGK